jgi:hypothetical protein
MQNLENAPKLVSLNKWLCEMGVTATTGWRWRKKGVLQTVNIYGRLYISEKSIVEFHQRATAGEFATELKPGMRKSGAGNG